MSLLTQHDLQRLIEDLRYATQRTNWIDQNYLGQLISTYGEVCEEVNIRLRKCRDLLNLGLRSEAIQLADEDPPLLARVQLLDLPEMDRIEALLAHHDMVLPPGLLLENAEQLNTAYAQHLQLAPLLREHRILALARAPLSRRIRVLRDLRQADPENYHWADDQRVWEQARQLELQQEIAAANQADDVEKLAYLLDEIQSPHWIQRPAPELLQLTQRALRKCSRSSARKSLAKLIANLESAHAEFDFPRAAALNQEWERIADQAELQANEELAVRYETVADWLNREQRQAAAESKFQQQLVSLRKTVESAKTAGEIEPQLHAALQYQRDIPRDLLQHAEQRLHALRKRAKQRWYFRIFGICATVAVILCGGLWYLREHFHARDLAVAQASLTKLIEASDFDKAEAYFSEVSSAKPRLANEAVMLELQDKLQNRKRQEQQRLEEQARIWQQIETAGLLSPDQAALRRAKQLVRTPDEKTRLANWEARLQSEYDRLKLERNQKTQREIELFRGQVQTLVEQAPPEDVAVVLPKFQALSAALLALSGAANTETAFQQQILALDKQLSSRLQELETLTEQQKSLQNWLQAGVTVEMYADALRDFQKKYPNTARGADCLIVVKEVELWKGAEDWAKFLRQGALIAPNLDAKTAKQLLTDAQNLEEAFPQHPHAAYFAPFKPQLAAVSQRVIAATGRPLISELESLLRNPLLSELHLLEKKTGEQYYLTEDLRGKVNNDIWDAGRFHDFKYLLDPNGQVATSGCRQVDLSYDALAPHSLLCQKLLLSLKEIDDQKWDKCHLDMVQLVEREYAASQPQPDSIVTAILLKRILAQGAAGSVRFQAALTKKNAVLASEDLDLSVNWLQQKGALITKAKKDANDILKTFTETKLLEPPAVPALAVLPERRGFLCRDLRGGWQWRQPGERPANGRLAIILPKTQNLSAELKTIGRIENGQLLLEPNLAEFREGRPVYFFAAVTSD